MFVKYHIGTRRASLGSPGDAAAGFDSSLVTPAYQIAGQYLAEMQNTVVRDRTWFQQNGSSLSPADQATYQSYLNQEISALTQYTQRFNEVTVFLSDQGYLGLGPVAIIGFSVAAIIVGWGLWDLYQLLKTANAWIAVKQTQANATAAATQAAVNRINQGEGTASDYALAAGQGVNEIATTSVTGLGIIAALGFAGIATYLAVR